MSCVTICCYCYVLFFLYFRYIFLWIALDYFFLKPRVWNNCSTSEVGVRFAYTSNSSLHRYEIFFWNINLNKCPKAFNKSSALVHGSFGFRYYIAVWFSFEISFHFGVDNQVISVLYPYRFPMPWKNSRDGWLHLFCLFLIYRTIFSYGLHLLHQKTRLQRM